MELLICLVMTTISKNIYNLIVLDFLFYYLTLWFEEHKDKLKWSTPLERAVYAVGLVTMSWLYTLSQILNYTNVISVKIFLWHYIIAALIIMQVYKYVYIKQKRYQLLLSRDRRPGSVNTRTGIIISIIIVLLSLILPFILIIIFVPFGGHQNI